MKDQTENYQGEFKNDKKHGYGLEYNDQGIVEYLGEFKYDVKDGLGSMKYEDNAFYIGEWRTGEHNGYVAYISI